MSVGTAPMAMGATPRAGAQQGRFCTQSALQTWALGYGRRTGGMGKGIHGGGEQVGSTVGSKGYHHSASHFGKRTGRGEGKGCECGWEGGWWQRWGGGRWGTKPKSPLQGWRSDSCANAASQTHGREVLFRHLEDHFRPQQAAPCRQPGWQSTWFKAYPASKRQMSVPHHTVSTPHHARERRNTAHCGLVAGGS
jgi:hypothetical protein